MKRLLITLGMILVLGLSSTMLCLAAEPVGSDTLADWDLEVPNFANTMSVLDGEDGNYYIYPSGERGIPYVMIHAYGGFDSPESFLEEFTSEVMMSSYPDLEVLQETSPVTIDGKDYCEIDYQYTVSGYICFDRRIACTKGDFTYMFASKEIPELDKLVGSLLEDTISNCKFPGDDEQVEVPPVSAPKEDSDIPELTWTQEVEDYLEEEGMEGYFYTFDEVDAMMWIPNFLEPVTLTSADREGGYIAYFTDQDWSTQIGVQYIYVDMTLDAYHELIQDLPQVDTVQDFIINGIPFIGYRIPDNDVMVLSTVTSAGYAMEFSFFPISSEDFLDYLEVIGTSIQAAK